MAISSCALQVSGIVIKPYGFGQLKTSSSSTFKAPFNKWTTMKVDACNKWAMKIDVSKTMKYTGERLLDAFVNSTFQFVDLPLHPSQSNLAPVEEIGEAIEITCIEGTIPPDFPEGIYVRNGCNHVYGSPKSSVSMFGRTNQVWIEGEGMLHAIYFKKKDGSGNWSIHYKNKYVESNTFKLEKQRNIGMLFIPNVEGDPFAVLAANLLNKLRFGTPAKHYQNVSVFEHAGKVFATSDVSTAQEVDLSTLQSLDYWDFNGDWVRPFCSHPKKAPGSGELVFMGVSGDKPYYVVGVVSADGKKLLHKADLKFNRSVLSHDIGVTHNYNVIIDHPLIVDLPGLINGGSLMKYHKEGYAKIGVMPRYGDADSVKWFSVKPNCTFHLVNCFEDGVEVVVRGCKAQESVIPGPERGENRFEWFSRGYNFTGRQDIEDIAAGDGSAEGETGYLFGRVHEWRLNMSTGQVEEKYLTGRDFSMDFPFINEHVTGRKHKYGYTQVIDSKASSESSYSKYGGLAKLYFDEQQSNPTVGKCEEEKIIKAEYHKFGNNIYCTGSAFVPKQGGDEEDDGWIITFVHNEDTNVSQAYIIDAKKLESKAAAVITLPNRVPYGHHGAFISFPN